MTKCDSEYAKNLLKHVWHELLANWMLQTNMRQARNNLVNPFLDVEAMVDDNSEEDDGDEEANVGASSRVPDCSVLAYSCIS